MLTVVAAPRLTKTFTDDPAVPGGTVTLQFTLAYGESDATGGNSIAFTDDLAAVLPGLAAIGLPANDVCGAGSQLSGTTLLSFTGGSLPPGGSCTFAVTLQVPAGATAGDHLNTTSNVMAVSGGVPVVGPAASDGLEIVGLTLAKSFTDDPVMPGNTVTLEFTIENVKQSALATNIAFTDNLSAVLAGLTAVGLPANDVCGVGSQISGTTTLSLTGGTLAAGASCTFDVTLQVPAVASPGEYFNATSTPTADLDGEPTTFVRATDSLLVTPPLSIEKSFTDDPVMPGDTVTLEFTIHNADPTQSATGITFTDDLDATLSGLVAVGLPANDVCGVGSQISGTSLLTLTGGSLPAASSCTFDVTLQVPANVPLGSAFTNTTSEVDGTVGGVETSGLPASDDLQIDAFTFSKAFDGPTVAGGSPQLTFTITNLSTTSAASGLAFTDDLDAVLPGLVATGLPMLEICGDGSSITGTSTISFSRGGMPPGGSCTVTVTLQVPAAAPPGTYPNATSDLTLGNEMAAAPATADLVIEPPPTFTKSFTPNAIGVGGLSMLSFVIDNSASVLAASALDFTDNLPAGVQVANPASASTSCTGGTLTANPGSGVVSYTGGSVAAGASCAVQAMVTATTAGAFLNVTGELTSSSGSSGTASATLTANPQPGFTKAFAPDPIAPNMASALIFTIDNSASTVATTALDFTDNLPAGVVVASPANASTTCTGGTVTATAGGGSVAYSGGSVAAGATCTVQADVTSAAAGNYVNVSGALTSSLGDSGTATATLSVVEGVVGLSKAFAAAPVLRGGLVELEFTVFNTSPDFPLSAVTFSDDLDAALPGLVAVGLPAANVCGAGSQLTGTSVVTLTGGSVAPDSSCTFAVTVQVPSDAPLGTVTNTTGAITASASGAPVDGPPASADLEVAFLTIAKSFDPSAVQGGETTVLTFILANPDPVNAAAAVAFTDDLDAVLPGMTAVGLPQSDVCGAGSQLTGTSTIDLSGGSLAPGGSCTFDVTVQVPQDAQSGSVTNVTSVVSAEVAGTPASGDPADVAQAALDVTGLPVVIPTLGWPGLLLLAGLLSLAGLWWLRRRG